MSDLTPVESHVRAGEVLDPEAALVIRGWPLTVDGLLRNADATRRRYSRAGRPFRRGLGRGDHGRVGSRRDPVGPAPPDPPAVPIARVVEAGFRLLPTFGAPHYSLVLPSYTQQVAQRLLEVMGEVKVNPHHVRREL